MKDQANERLINEKLLKVWAMVRQSYEWTDKVTERPT